MTVLFVLFVLFALLVLAGLALLGIAWFVRKLNRGWDKLRWGQRLGFLGAGVAVIASPYLAYKAAELRHVLARVPEPLQVSWIEYRVEEAWGIGMPGDNETGLVVYRLSGDSAQWARARGASLGQSLTGVEQDWRPTPVADRAGDGRKWHPYDDERPMRAHGADIMEYLDRYGFGIPVAQERADEVNRAIRTPGSFYSYGRGGSITIVDPRHGKVYFAYAG